MKVATLNDGLPDGRLVVVSEDLSVCHPATFRNLQMALDHDAVTAEVAAQRFDPSCCLAPLPRAYQFLDGSAYVNHVDLVRRARGAEMPQSFWTDPLMYQGGSDGFLAPTADISGDPDWGVDFEAEVAVITTFVPMGTPADRAGEFIRYVTLINDVSLRGLIPAELSKGFGFVQSKPASAMAPVAVTPDVLSGWDGGKLNGTLNVDLNGEAFGRAGAGVDMTFDFPTLIAHAAKTRHLAAGTIIGSGTVSNRDASGGPGQPVADGGTGYSCIAEQRMVEVIEHGAARTPFLRAGDHVRIWMEDAEGRSIFGEIAQTFRPEGETP
ncbi:MAG: fumarylacetoacetate hydrolase family protein [Pseudomonadota bacterium]